MIREKKRKMNEKENANHKNSSYLDPIEQIAEKEEKKWKKGGKGQIRECVNLVRTLVFIKRGRKCFKNKDASAPAKIRLDSLLQSLALMIILLDGLTNARNLGNEWTSPYFESVHCSWEDKFTRIHFKHPYKFQI